MRSWYPHFATAAISILVSLSCVSDKPPLGRCEGVTCAEGQSCNPANGRCEGPDAGPGDPQDSGVVDGSVTDDAGVTANDGGGVGTFDGGPGCFDDSPCAAPTPKCDVPTGQCVECVRDLECADPSKPKCEVTSHRCVQCRSGVDCFNPTPSCSTAATCGACTTDVSCGPGRQCADGGSCQPLPDSCANPELITLVAGHAVVRVDPSRAVDELGLVCGTAGAPELVYSFALSEATDLRVSANRSATIALRSACDAALDVVCAQASVASGAAVLNVAAGTYFLIVEQGSWVGPLEVTIDAQTAASAPANDACTSPAVLTLGADSRLVVMGDTRRANNSATGTNDPTCSPTAALTGKDVVYQYTLTRQSDVTLKASAVYGSGLQPVLSVRTDCASVIGSELGCNVGAAATLSFPSQAAGTYFIWVDGAEGSTGAFSLELTATSLGATTACTSPPSLTFANGAASVSGNTAVPSASTPPSASRCETTALPKGVVYSYTLTAARDVSLSVKATGASPTFKPVLSVRSVCTSANELQCLNVSSTPLVLAAQPAGTYFVWVSGLDDTAGAFDLEVVTSPPSTVPTNDACTGPQRLGFMGNVAKANGSTRQARNDRAASPCSPSANQTGRDVAYEFTLLSAQDLTVEVRPRGTESGAWQPVLTVGTSSCTASDVLACAVGPSVSLTNVQAGTYLLWVDGAAGTSGDFELEVTRRGTTPAPPNDSCPGAQAIVFTNNAAILSATTTGASNSQSSTSQTPTCGSAGFPRVYGRDVVYLYTLTEASDVELRVSPEKGSALVPTVAVQKPNQCTSEQPTDQLACVAATRAELTPLRLPNQAPGTYPVIIDSNSFESGRFTLQVTRRAAVAPPANETCSAPEPLTLNVVTTGDTSWARDDVSSCQGQATSSRDLVYSFVAPSSGVFSVKVTPSAGFDVALSMLTGSCSAAACSRLSDSGARGVPEMMTFSALAGQTVWFAVDGARGDTVDGTGSFSLAVQ